MKGSFFFTFDQKKCLPASKIQFPFKVANLSFFKTFQETQQKKTQNNTKHLIIWHWFIFQRPVEHTLDFLHRLTASTGVTSLLEAKVFQGFADGSDFRKWLKCPLTTISPENVSLQSLLMKHKGGKGTI